MASPLLPLSVPRSSHYRVDPNDESAWSVLNERGGAQRKVVSVVCRVMVMRIDPQGPTQVLAVVLLLLGAVLT